MFSTGAIDFELSCKKKKEKQKTKKQKNQTKYSLPSSIKGKKYIIPKY